MKPNLLNVRESKIIQEEEESDEDFFQEET